MSEDIKISEARASNPLVSKRWTAYVLTLTTLVVLAILHVEGESIENVSIAILLGLPTLLGGESAVRVAETRRGPR